MAAKRKRHPTQGTLVSGEVTALVAAPEARGTTEAGDAVRVQGGVPGDRGVFRVVHAGKNATWVRPHELSAPSTDRMVAPCPVVAQCGGCPWQPVSLTAQRAAKLRLLVDALGGAEALAGVDVREVAGPGPDREGGVLGYRTRALMMTRHLSGRLTLGFYAPRTNQVVRAEGCVVQHPRVNAVLAAAREVLFHASLSTWRDVERRGLLRAVLFRLDPGSRRGGLLTLVVSEDSPRLDEVAGRLLALEDVTGVYASLQPDAGGPVLGPTTRHLAGDVRQRMAFADDLVLEVGPVSFVQTLHGTARRLVALVRELAPPEVGHVVDAYAGVGVLGFALADRARRVTLVESSPHAAADAEWNGAAVGHLAADNDAEAGDADGATAAAPPDPGSGGAVACLETDANDAVPRLLASEDPPDVVVLDPPRAGCQRPLLDALVENIGRVRTVIYVSCNPATLARDLAHLADGGFVLEVVAPIDMFPHTHHLEVVCRLRGAAPAAGPSPEPGVSSSTEQASIE